MMILHPGIDPVAISLGPLQIHWYGVMYLVAFVGGAWLGVDRSNRPDSGWKPNEVWDLLFYVALGVILGGRLGYVVFYNLSYFIDHPQEIVYIWTGGMSFHGGLLGVLTAIFWFARRTHRSFFAVADFLAPLFPLGIGAVRISNFINQELWGRVTDLPWGVVFSTGGPLPRHPTQLYEAFLEGVLLFVILWLYSGEHRRPGRVSALFLIIYGLSRITVEFVRMPDDHIGYLYGGWVTMGHLLSLPMLLLGVAVFWRSSRS